MPPQISPPASPPASRKRARDDAPDDEHRANPRYDLRKRPRIAYFAPRRNGVRHEICQPVPAKRRDDVFPVLTPPVTPPPPASPRPYTAIPRMPNFTCTFVREIQTTSAAAVLLVALPDSTRRVLKLFPPPRPSCPRDPFLRESTAYASLQQHSVANVPRCHGTIEITALRRQLRGSAAWHSAFKQHQRLRGLLLDFIPDATTLMAAPERLLQRPALVDAVVAGLERIHQAGVLHQDTLPRNIMVDAHDRVWWIDFGCALSTAAGRIDPREFEAELEAMRDLLREDVVPAAREGRTPEWWIIGA